MCIVILYFLSSSFLFTHSIRSSDASLVPCVSLSLSNSSFDISTLSLFHLFNPLTGGRELPTTERHSVYENGTLIISDTSRELDEGVYVCRAVNDKGEQPSRNLQIQVLSESTLCRPSPSCSSSTTSYLPVDQSFFLMEKRRRERVFLHHFPMQIVTQAVMSSFHPLPSLLFGTRFFDFASFNV